jgi:hypothetical protein
MLPLLGSHLEMQVYREDPREAGLGRVKMRGFPHSDDPEEAVKGELWVGVAPSGQSPVTWIQVKGILWAVKPRGEGLIPSSIKSDETQTPCTCI